MSGAEDEVRDSLIKEFCTITGAGAQVAEQLLAVCNNNLEMAINMHMEGVDVPAANAPASSGASASGAGASSRAGGSSTCPPVADDDDDEDNVRAPIPQKQERMIEAGFEGYALNRVNPNRARIRSVFDGFRNFGNESGSNGGINCTLALHYPQTEGHAF